MWHANDSGNVLAHRKIHPAFRNWRRAPRFRNLCLLLGVRATSDDHEFPPSHTMDRVSHGPRPSMTPLTMRPKLRNGQGRRFGAITAARTAVYRSAPTVSGEPAAMATPTREGSGECARGYRDSHR